MRIRNVAFVVVGVLVLTLSLVWFVVTMALGKIAGGVGVLCSALLTLLALLLVVYWRVLTPQQGSCVIIALLLVLPAAIHVVQGSLEASAGVLVWTTIGPLLALCERMDAAAVECGVFKVATIGDAYFAVCGAPDALGAHDAATRMALFALAVRDLVARETARFGVQLRIGLHSGPVVAGVLGVLAPQFTLIGDTVNTASRMESHGAPGKVHCSAATRTLLRGRFRFAARTPLNVKGKGVMQTYWLLGPRVRGDGDGGDPTELASPSEAALRHLYLTRTALPPSPPTSPTRKSVLHEAATFAASIRPLAMSTKKFGVPVVRTED